MVFSDGDIKRLLGEGKIKISPELDLRTQLGSCSIDLRLGYKFRVYNYPRTITNKIIYIDTRDPDQTRYVREVVVQDDEPFFLHPEAFVLADTVERVELANDIVGRLDGRSSLARLGVIVQATASIVDPGFKGTLVLELANHNTIPVALYPGMRICSLTFESVSKAVEVPYYCKPSAKYVDQSGPVVSRISDDNDRPSIHTRENGNDFHKK